MEQELQVKTITVNDKSIKDGNNGQYAKLKDERGLTYTVSELKQDGSTSKAWQNLPKKGECVEIGFVEIDKSFMDDSGAEKAYKARYIRFISPSDEEPVIREPRQSSGGGSSGLKPKPKPDKI